MIRGARSNDSDVVRGGSWNGHRPLKAVTGFRMARQHRFDEHRVWIVRSFALAFGIVINRLWMPLWPSQPV